MTIDVRDGVVRLQEADFQRLVEGSDLAGSHPAVDAVPGVRTALDVVRSPAAVLHATVATERSIEEHRAWIGPDVVVLLLAVREDQRQLLVSPPDLLAPGLARLLRLGPRRAVSRTARGVEPEVLTDLVAETEILRRSAFAMTGADRAWALGLSWPDGDRWLGGADGPDGWWLVDGDERAARLVPTTATQIWRRLTTLLLGGRPD